MEGTSIQREPLSTQPHSQWQSLTRTLRANLPKNSNKSRYNNDISAIPSQIENSENSDPLLIVSVSNSQNSQQPPSRPKHHMVLILVTIVDLIVITLFSMQSSWNHTWDLIGLGIFRIIVVLGMTSSIWIRDLGWILGGTCGVSLSPLFVIPFLFKLNS
jgi:hypothetical protein